MTVKHGLVGQKLMKDMTRKVHWLRTQFPSLDIEVDGGVGPDTIHKCAEVRLLLDGNLDQFPIKCNARTDLVYQRDFPYTS